MLDKNGIVIEDFNPIYKENNNFFDWLINNQWEYAFNASKIK